MKPALMIATVLLLAACGGDSTRHMLAAVETTAGVKLSANAYYDTDDWIYPTFSGFPADPRAAITVSRRGSPHDRYARIVFTDGDTSGEAALGPLSAGEYILRGYSHVDADNVPHEAQAIVETPPFVIFAETRSQ